MNWIYNLMEMESLDDFGDNIGFVYEIFHEPTGKRYIGKKILHHTKTLPPLKGKKRKRRKVVESDWKSYTGSNKISKQWRIEDCTRRIHYVCKFKTLMSYYETMLQFKNNVLEDDSYLNDNIGGKYYRDTIKEYKNR